MDWFKGIFTGKPHDSWGNLWVRSDPFPKKLIHLVHPVVLIIQIVLLMVHLVVLR